MAPPPVCQALLLPFQVSLPGSPGAGTAQDDLVLDRKRSRRERRIGRIGERGFPFDLAALLVGSDDARRAVGGGDHKVSPQCRAAIALLLRLLRVHAPDDATNVARGAV